MGRQIYLDFNASTPVAPEVLEAMKPFMEGLVGNPSSQHWAGHPYKEALSAARRQVAQLLGCHDDEIIFTSGGSEANNLAIKGIFFTSMRGKHIVTSKTEHPSVVGPCEYLRKFGAEISYVPVDSGGRVNPDDVKSTIRSETALISIMHANNEIGTIQPLKEISKFARAHRIPFHTDAAQTIGKIPVNVGDLGIDLLTLAGHKFHAPKGVGALFIRRGTSIEPLIHGANHEFGMRAGTEAVPLCVALGKACEIASNLSDMPRIISLRNLFRDLLSSRFGQSIIFNGHKDFCLPNTLSVSFIDRIGSQILSRVPDLAASTGSACHSGSQSLSSTLLAIGLQSNIGAGTIRFSLGKSTSEEDIRDVVEILSKAM